MPLKRKIYQVDAFTAELFKGNPAAIMPLEAFLPDTLMQDIAAENNLSETAYVVTGDIPGHYDLRWFTPFVEIDFCGHATVATAHILATELGHQPPFTFQTQIGELTVAIVDGLYQLDAPVFKARPTDVTSAMGAAFPGLSQDDIVEAFWGSNNLFLVFKTPKHVIDASPDMAKIIPLSDHGVAITARALDNDDYDYVSRFFVPAEGIDEDPVTGSAHAAIGPYWAGKLGQSKLTAYQASKRGGFLYLDIGDDRLTISGRAVTYMRGEIEI